MVGEGFHRLVAATVQTFPAIWYTSGTPITTGQRSCGFERYLNYHAGRHGTGFKRRSTNVPFATGIGVHSGVQMIGEWLIDWQAAHPQQRYTTVDAQLDEVIGWAAATAADDYARTARTRGLELTKTDLDAAAAVEQLILEQRTLIEAQVWIYGLVRLPVMLAEYRVLNVEYDESPVVDCTCGLGDWVGDSTMHSQRGCAGICLQAKADFIWEGATAATSNKLVYEEFKTKATPNYGWEMAWEHSGQLLLNMEAASRRLGRDVSEAFVPVLYKGKRDRANREDLSSPKIQQSPLVWAWFDPGNGMNRPPEWAAQFKWYDDWGKGHTLGKTFKRARISDESLSLPFDEPNPNGYTPRVGASRVEHWVKGWILPGQWPDLLTVLGPFPKPRSRVPDAVQSLLASERRWRGDVALLREHQVFNATDRAVLAGDDGDSQSITAADLIDRSWQCTKFDGTPCQFKVVCHRESGSEAGIENMEQFEIRVPHHDTERIALTPLVESLGMTWPGDDDEDGGTE